MIMKKKVLTKTAMFFILVLSMDESLKKIKKLYDEKKIEILDYEISKTIEEIETIIKEIKK